MPKKLVSIVALVFFLHSISPISFAAETLLEPPLNQEKIHPTQSLTDTKISEPEQREIAAQMTAQEFFTEEATLSAAVAASNATVLPAKPRLGSFDSNVPPARFNVVQQNDPTQSDPQIRILHNTYNTTSGSFGGSVIQFNSPVDLSAQSQFVFDLRTDNTTPNSCAVTHSNCVKVEFVDAAGRVASVFIADLTNDFQERVITQQLLRTSQPDINFSQIRQINFVIDHSMVQGKSNGSFDVRTGGLYFEPSVVSGTGPVTDLKTHEVAANPVEPQNHDTVTAFNLSTTQFSYNYNLANGAANDFSQWAAAQLNFNVPFNLNNGDLVLGVKGTGTNRLKAEVVSLNSSGQPVRATLILEGLSSNNQFYRISKDLLDQTVTPGFDTSKMTSITFVVDAVLAGNPAATGTIEISTLGINTVFAITPDPTNPAVTLLPLTSEGISPQPTAFASDGSTSNVTILSSTFATLNLNLTAADAFGGFFLNYDGEATGTQFTDLVSAFPNGIVFQLDNGGSDITQVQLEVIDIFGKRDSVLLTEVESFGKKWKILTSQFDEVDATKIASIALLVAGQHPQGKLNLDWGAFTFTPSIPADLSNPEITPVPLIDNDRPVLTGFASDTSAVTVNQVSSTFSQIDINLNNEDSFGGAFVEYESIDLTAFFPNGIVLGLDNGGTGITEVLLEITDVNGDRDSVKLVGIEDFGKRWKIQPNQFEGIDITKVKTLAIVVSGQQANARLNLDWGNFDAPQGSDASNPAITLLPALVNGFRPVPQGFTSDDSGTASVAVASQTFASLNVNLSDEDSFGGLFLNYEGLTSGDAIDLASAFPNGIVFGLDNGGSDITEVLFEVTDSDGNKDSVRLGNIENFGKRWKILTSQLDDVNIHSITTISFVVSGQHLNGKLNLDWGIFQFVPQIPADLSNPAITPVPLFENDLPVLSGFASPGGTVTLNQPSVTFSQIDFNLPNTDSYGGVFFNYDNTSTAGTIETVNFETAFPDGIVLALDNGGTALTEVSLEVTDILGNRDSVKLVGIESFGKRWKVLTRQFEIDMTQVQNVVVVVAGQQAASRLNLDWGNFFAPQGNDASNPAIKLLPVTQGGYRPIPGNYASTGSTSNLNVASQTFASLELNLVDEASYGGLYFSYDIFGTPQVETIDLEAVFPNGIVFGLDNGGSDITEVYFEVTDADGNKDSVLLGNIESFGKRWKILLSQLDDVNIHEIVTFVFGVVGKHPNGKLNLDWGNFWFVPPIPADLSNPEITYAPPQNGEPADLVGFASNDSSSANVNILSSTFAQIDFDLRNPASYGGAAIFYSDPFDMSNAFPAGWVLGLDNGGTGITEISLEVVDVHGKSDRVTLTGIQEFGKRWKVLPSQFDEIDLTQIKTLSLILVGNQTGRLNLDWGNFFAPQGNDASNPAIKLLPVTQGGFRPIPGSYASTGSTSNLNVASQTFASLELNLVDEASYGGLYFSYDIFGTPQVETIDLEAVFPNGIVFGLDNGGSDITEVYFEVTDADGNKDSVLLGNIENFGKRWKILLSQLEDVNIHEIVTFVFGVAGEHPNGKLNLDWGNFWFVPPIPADLSNPAITFAPQQNGQPSNLVGFASNDSSSANVNIVSPTFAQVDFDLRNPASYGGAAIFYSTPIDLTEAFPEGLVLGLDNGGTGITEITLEVMDVHGKWDRVKLAGIQEFGKRWKVLPSQFDEIDLTQIRTLALTLTGNQNGRLNLDWGTFLFVSKIPPSAGNPAITPVPLIGNNPPPITAFKNGESSTASIVLNSPSEGVLKLDLVEETAYGGAFISYDNPQTSEGEFIDLDVSFPEGMVLGLQTSNPDISEIALIVTDVNGVSDRVFLTSLGTTMKRWVIQPSLFKVDRAHVQTISFAISGTHRNLDIGFEWGNFAFTPIIENDSASLVQLFDANEGNYFQTALANHSSANTPSSSLPSESLRGRPDVKEEKTVEENENKKEETSETNFKLIEPEQETAAQGEQVGMLNLASETYEACMVNTQLQIMLGAWTGETCEK